MSTAAPTSAPPSIRRPAWLGSAGRVVRTVAGPFAGVGSWTIFSARTLAAMPATLLRSTRRRDFVLQMDHLGVGALPITHITGFISGLLLGLQTRVSLEQFGITSLFSQMLTLALVREVGPTFVALVAGSRAASGIASELATMGVTNQVDAMRALRRDPIHALAAPRVLACLVAFPCLAVVGIIAGLFGGMLIGNFALHQTPSFFFHQAFEVLGVREIFPNLIVKPALFGLYIGLVSCWMGLQERRGTAAVGEATVQAVVFVTVGIIFIDYTAGELFPPVVAGAAMVTPEAPLAFRDVTFRRNGNLILDRVSLEVRPGETVALLGPSGAGKTTLFRLALGFLQADAGEVWVAGREVSHLTERELFPIRAQVGIVFQNGALFTSMDVSENVGFGLAETGLAPVEIDHRVARALENVGLAELAHRMPDELSGGQAQRVAVARAIVTEPRIMLYDEPTQGLDPRRALDVVAEIERLQREGVASLVITHQLEYARKYADRIALLLAGRITYDGPPAGLRALDEPFIQSFFHVLDAEGVPGGA